MCMVERQPPLPEWMQEAIGGFQEIMKSWGCSTLSALHKDGRLSMTTLRKLDPRNPDPSICMDTVVDMIGKLMNMALLIFSEGELPEVQATLASVLARIVAAHAQLTASDKAEALKRKRIRHKHQFC